MDAHALECLDFPRVRELVASYALTGLGRGLAGQIRPITRREMIQRWLTQVQELQRLIEQRGMPPFGGITDVREVVRNCAPPLRVTVDQIALVRDALAGTHAMTAYFHELPADFPELHHLAERVGDFEAIANRIRAVIDERGQVRDDASPKLQRIRHEIEQASAKIGETMAHLLHDPAVRRLLQYPNPTFHNDRTVLPLRTEYRGRLPGIIHRTSDSGATVYVEPAQAVELNNQITNLRLEEQEEINHLLWELAHEIHLNAKDILKSLDTLAVIDLIVAKVRFAHDFALICPQISADGLLNVRQARHPLLIDLHRRRLAAGEKSLEVVPIDYRLGDDFDVLLITGPNTGGKTVTLKTVGLINLMLQSGLPVPVGEGSTIGLFYDILIDVGDEQSMQQSLSTFGAHLTRLLDMLRRAARKTLVLIDELGAGTDPDEGAAIGKAILDELRRLQARGLVTTHLGALKAYALTNDRAENASVEFDIQTLRPTYHLRIGESGSSNAIDIALQLGMPRRLVLAARRNLSVQARTLRAALRGTAEVKRQAEQARTAAETAKLDADRAQTEAGAARQRLERQQAAFQQWVQRVVHLQPGDAVRVRNFDRDGKIVRVRLDQQRAEVDVGAFAVEVPLGDILPPETLPPPPRAPAPPPVSATAPEANPQAAGASSDHPRRDRTDRPRRDRRDRPRRDRVGPASGPSSAGPATGVPPVGQASGLPSNRPEFGPSDQPRRPDRSPPADRPPRRDRPPRSDRPQGQGFPPRADRAPRPDRPPRADRPPQVDTRPPPPPMSDTEADALQTGEPVYVKRFHREGSVVRVKPTRKVVIVSVGLLEVEVPYNGLAAARSRESAKPPAPPRAAKPPAAEAASLSAAPSETPAPTPGAPSEPPINSNAPQTAPALEMPPAPGASEMLPAPPAIEESPPP